MKKIYLDYAATTPVDSKILKAILPYLKKNFGNPSSIHHFGQRALLAMEEARKKVADFLGCQPEEIFFTGSATEANNLAVLGLVKALKQSGKLIGKAHIITTKIEHHAILEPCRHLEKQGIEITYLQPGQDGMVKISDVEKSIKENTVLVSIMYVNNEIGVIQPIAEIGRMLSDKGKKNKIYFHTDAVQAVNYLDCNAQNLGCDLLSLSGHKIYGPKGVGAIYVKKGTPIEPLIYGGGQEGGLRSGTENVAWIAGLGEAIEQIQKDPLGTGEPKIRIKSIIIKKLRDKLIAGVLKSIPNSSLNGSRVYRIPNNANFSFKGVEGEAVVIALDQEGIAVSTGSACSSKSLEPSHVILGLGLSEEEAHSSLRVTLGKYTSEGEIEALLKTLPKVIKKLRKISGYNPLS